MLRRMVVGCGYLGQRVAARWLASGDEVFVTTRHENRAVSLAAAGFRPLVCDVTQPDSLDALVNAGPCDTVLFAVGFDRSAGDSIQDVYVHGLSHVIAALPETKQFIYISSTGVYGQSHGEWVDEQSECRPTRPGGQACLAAEQLLGQSPLSDRSIVLRLAGIYGPSRIPNRRALETAQPIVARIGSYLNLIHIEDAVQAVTESAMRAAPPVVFVVSDNHPVERREYYIELARLIGVERSAITFVDPPPQPQAQRKTGNKRVRSAAIMSALALRWNYPSYLEGLAAVVAADTVEAEKADP